LAGRHFRRHDELHFADQLADSGAVLIGAAAFNGFNFARIADLDHKGQAAGGGGSFRRMTTEGGQSVRGRLCNFAVLRFVNRDRFELLPVQKACGGNGISILREDKSVKIATRKS